MGKIKRVSYEISDEREIMRWLEEMVDQTILSYLNERNQDTVYLHMSKYRNIGGKEVDTNSTH